MPQTQLLSEKVRGHIRHPFPIIPCLVILQWTNLHWLSTLSSCVFRPDSSALTFPFGGGRNDPQEKPLLHPDPHQFGAGVLWEAEIILKLQDTAALGIYFCWQKKRVAVPACPGVHALSVQLSKPVHLCLPPRYTNQQPHMEVCRDTCWEAVEKQKGHT